MAPRTRVLVALALVAAATVAVVLVSKRPAAPPAAVDPALLVPGEGCDHVFVVPDLGRLGDRLADLGRLKIVQTAAQLAGAASAEELFTELARQLGFDPRSRPSMRAVGVDPARPLVAVLRDGGSRATIAAVPVADPARLDAFLARVAADRFGAARRPAAASGTVVYASEAGVQLAWAARSDYALVALGPAAEGALQATLSLDRVHSLAAFPSFSAMRARFAAAEAFEYLCPGTPRGSAAGLAYDVGAGLFLAAGAIRIAAEVSLTEGLAKELASFATAAGGELVGKLDPDATLVLRLGGDPDATLGSLAKFVPRELVAMTDQAKIDLGTEIFGNLKPGVALSLALAPTAQLGAAPDLDPRRTNPFRYVHLAALGRAKDPATAAETLAKIARAAPRFGAQVAERDVAGARVYTARYHLGEGASWTLKGDALAVTGGPGRMDALLGRLGAGGPGFQVKDPAARRSLETDGWVFLLDVGRLIASVRALPDSAWGVGGFAIRAAAARWLDAFEEISSVRASARAVDRALAVELVVSLAPATPEPKKP